MLMFFGHVSKFFQQQSKTNSDFLATSKECLGTSAKIIMGVMETKGFTEIQWKLDIINSSITISPHYKEQ